MSDSRDYQPFSAGKLADSPDYRPLADFIASAFPRYSSTVTMNSACDHVAVYEEAAVAGIAHRLVGLADAREVDVTHGVGRVEADQRVAVPDDEAPGHVGPKL
jgi:hypothetical protein